MIFSWYFPIFVSLLDNAHIVPVARLEAFRALKLFRLESFRAQKYTGPIGGVYEVYGTKILQIRSFSDPNIIQIGEFHF